MVATLEATGAIRSVRVRQAFLAEPRERYVPEIAERDGLGAVYQAQVALVTVTDRNGGPLSSSSAPAVMAPMLEQLALRPGLRALEVGTGTGYNAALMKRLVGKSGSVTSVEVSPAIAEKAKGILGRYDHDVNVVTGDGRAGWPPSAPYDGIIATASSAFVPRAWRDQVKEGGVVVLPFRWSADMANQMILGLRREGALLRSRALFPGRFMPLRDAGATESPAPHQVRLEASVSSASSSSLMTRLTGGALHELSPTERRRVLVLVLSDKREGRTISAEQAPGFHTFLALYPGARTISCSFDDRSGTGVLGPDGGSFAAIIGPFGGSATVEAWGGAAAEEHLCALLAEWEGLGRPALGDLTVTFAYGGGPSEAHPAWQTWTTPEGTVRLDWGTTARA